MTSHRRDGQAETGTEGYANPFCVLGLSADAPGINIQQTAQRALMERQLGEAAAKVESEIRAIEDAQERLKDPVARFHAALHWVTLDSQEFNAWVNLTEMRSLAFDRTMLANDAYERLATTESVATRNHNIAVLLCADAHRLASLGNLEAATKSWDRGFERWALCLASDEFLQRQRLRARSLDDARLTPASVSADLAGVPRRLLAEPATLASQALESRRVSDAVSLVALIRSAPFEAEFIDGVLETVYRPLARRIESEIDQLDSRRADLLTSRDDSAASAEPVCGELRGLLMAFKEHVAPDLEEMLELGDLPGLAEEHARDHASRFLEQLGLDAWNKADDADLAQEATQLASRYADAKSLKNKLANSLRQLSDHAVLGSEIEEILDLAVGPSAPKAIERLKALKAKVNSAESQKQVSDLITRVSEAYAARLFKEAASLAKRKQPHQAVIEKLEESMRWAIQPETKRTIHECIATVRIARTKNVSGVLEIAGSRVAIMVLLGLLSLILTQCE